MRKTKSTDEQISFALKQAEFGTPVAEIIRKMETPNSHSTAGNESLAG